MPEDRDPSKETLMLEKEAEHMLTSSDTAALRSTSPARGRHLAVGPQSRARRALPETTRRLGA